MASIKAYIYGTTSAASSGDYSLAIDCGDTVVSGADSSATPFTLKVDTSGYSRSGAYTISLTGAYAARYRLAATSAALSAAVYGDPITISGPVTYDGTTIWLQKKAVMGDETGANTTRAQLSLPQDNITSG